MSKIDEAKEILNALQVPAKQQNAMCCCVLLAMAGLVEETSWQDATNEWIRIHDVIAFSNNNPCSIQFPKISNFLKKL